MPISVVGIDGTPEVHPQVRARTFEHNTKNQGAFDQDTEQALVGVLNAVQGLTADSDGADLIATLGLARDLAVSGGTPAATVVVLDPMLPDTGPLQLTRPGWATAEPAEVADHLVTGGNLPDATGLHYRLVGVGHTAPPQEPLTTAMRDNVTATWTEILTRGGAASVVADPAPRQGDGPDTPFTTATVPVPVADPGPVCEAAPRVYDATSPLAFVADQAVLRDPEAASAALADVAAWLAGDPARRASVVGTSANVGDLAGQIALSRRRAAEAVRLLTEVLHVPADRLTSDGVGSAFPEYVPDTDDPAARQANRSVRITLSGPSAGC
jgi:outer membrane protein OmpA-like peptidoglycan-associated protein